MKVAHSKLRASEELITLSKEVMKEIEKLRSSKDDDDFEAGYKKGARDYLFKVNDMICSRLEKLFSEEENKKDTSATRVYD